MRYFIFLSVFFIGTGLAQAKTSELFTYNINDQAYEGYYVDAGKDAPFIFMIHDWDGLTEYEVKRAEMLGDLGYSVLAIDLFGAGIRPTENKDKRQHTGALYKDREKMQQLMYGALEIAKTKGANIDQAIALGYCFGGAAVLELARSGADLKGFVTFHGGLTTPKGQNYSKTKGELLILHGTADSAITMDDFGALAKELEASKIKHEMITYGGAKHAFTVFGSGRYDEDADQKSWTRFTQFLNQQFGR